MMPQDPASVPATVHRLTAGGSTPAPDHLACEEPLEIRVRGQAVAITMRTPGHDEELAAGFLLTEGLLRARTDWIEAAPCRAEGAIAGNILNVFLAPDVPVDLARLTRHVFTASSCGLCGKASIEAIHQQFPPILTTQTQVPWPTLKELPLRLRAAQASFDLTGGLHAAALFDLDGRLLCLREDVGRHNAVDKVLGHAFLSGWLPLERHILLVSGRASFEIMQKSLAAAIPVVAAISAPSSLAVEFARQSGQTLYGFLRGDTANLYT